jgi:hypothetical protein
MADKLPFFAAEGGTWQTASPNPHIHLSGTALTLGTYPAQTFADAAADTTLDFATTNTCTIVAWVDATHWARYEGAVWTDASPDVLDLSAATLMGVGPAGGPANDESVSVVASLPVTTPANIGAEPAANITAAARTVFDDATVGDMVNTLGGATSTGTGGLARATSPTFVTPVLGTPTSGTLSGCTGYPAASTSAAGVAPQATAPASGLINVVAIGNGETAYTNKALLDSTAPAALGTAAAGTATVAARRDHVHADPAMLTIQASETLAAGNIVNIYTATGALRVQKADASGTTKVANGFVLAEITSGNSGSVYVSGTVTGLSGLTPGGDCWLNQAAAGGVTQTAPNEATTGKLIQLVGKALTASTMVLQLGPAIIT